MEMNRFTKDKRRGASVRAFYFVVLFFISCMLLIGSSRRTRRKPVNEIAAIKVPANGGGNAPPRPEIQELAASPPMTPFDLWKALIDFLIATSPAVVLYFIGWAYLYSFLSAFGINMAEIHMDTPTIFIYSFSPLYKLAMSYGLHFLFVIGGLLLIWAAVGYLPHRIAAPVKFGYEKATGVISKSVAAKLFVFVVASIFVALSLLQVSKITAIQASDRLWKDEGAANTLALISEKDAKPSAGLTKFPYSQWRASYDKCVDEQALLLIYSDDKAYYFLCKSKINKNEGLVFEVRRELGLVSVRFAAGGKP
jgi:hypothetical protein